MLADIFCRVVDNYGDIGVCWRLARRLSQGHGWRIRLWVDDLGSFARIQPGIDASLAEQALDGIDIIHWGSPPPQRVPGDVVIEAFACDPPVSFVQTMQRQFAQTGQAPIWINLEYLSAESWVESCHGLPSQRADGLTKHFFFPGFTPATGGLLREPGLSAERDALQSSRPRQAELLRRLGLGGDCLQAWQAGARLISLFCYPNAPMTALAQALGNETRASVIIAPSGVYPDLEAVMTAAPVRIARIPFVSQPDFDRLLWCADLNFVRGEDSFIRAVWAARPLIWQIYPQDENAHLTKLDAWLAQYPCPDAVRTAIRAWNVPLTTSAAAALSAVLRPSIWENWQKIARNWDEEHASRPDLGDNLVDFCAELSRKR